MLRGRLSESRSLAETLRTDRLIDMGLRRANIAETLANRLNPWLPIG